MKLARFFSWGIPVRTPALAAAVTALLSVSGCGSTNNIAGLVDTETIASFTGQGFFAGTVKGDTVVLAFSDSVYYLAGPRLDRFNAVAAPTQFVLQIAFGNGETAVRTRGQQILRLDEGRWSEWRTPITDSVVDNVPVFLEDLAYVKDGFFAVGDRGTIMRTRQGSWIVDDALGDYPNEPQHPVFWDLDGSRERIAAVGAGVVIWTENGGWVRSDGPEANCFLRLVAVPATSIVVAGGMDVGCVYETADGGRTWTERTPAALRYGLYYSQGNEGLGAFWNATRGEIIIVSESGFQYRRIPGDLMLHSVLPTSSDIYVVRVSSSTAYLERLK